jgi:peptide/nickel transport system permease protein
MKVVGRAGLWLLHLVLVLFLVSLGTFLMLKLTPGDPAVEMLGSEATPEAIRDIHHQLGLDRPLVKQYGHWIGGAIHGDLGQSLAPPRGPVMLRLREAFPVTIELAVLAALIALVVAVPLGILAAYRAGSRVDSMINGMAYGLVSVPNFLAGLLIAYLFTVQLRIFPSSQWVRLSASFTGNLRSAFLPAATLALTEIAVYMRLLRNDMVLALESDYMAFAQAKGLSTRRLLLRHALRPSSLSVVTLSSVGFARLLGGAAIVEVIFALPGVGRLLVGAIGANDFPLVQGTVLAVATIYVIVNALIDAAYGVLDPRIRHGGA